MPRQSTLPLPWRQSSRPARLVAFGLLALLIGAPDASAQETRDLQVHFGELTYRLFCVGCHGVGGRGGGEVAEALEMPLGDLTLIARRNGGVFPAGDVADAITGRSPGGHRELAMQPWGEMFEDEFERFAEELAADAMAARRIDHLLAYLESIQR